MKVSVIILNWNGAKMLEQYLPSVIRHSQQPDIEIVIADNGSTDDSLSVAKRFGCRVIELDRNYGFAEGYNLAIAQTDAEYVILLNSDVEVTSGWIDPLIAYMDAHPDVAAVQPKVLSWLHKSQFEYAGAAGGYMDKLCYPYCRGRILSYVEKDHGQYDTVTDVFWATGACLCTRTRLYKELGGLDSDFFAHMEEIDLCWRMNSRGWRLACVPQSVIYHLGGGSLNYENPKKTFLNFRNSLIMIYKNLPDEHFYRVMIARFVLDIAASLHYLLIFKPANAWAVIRAWSDYLKRKQQFAAKRRTNLQAAIVPYPTIIAQRSILFDYYFRGKRQ